MSIFTKVKAAKLKSSRFNLSEEHKLSCNFGEMIPILCKEVLPKDYFEISTELLIKLAPLKAPIMHRIKAKVDYFFVPNFQITDIFADFINPKVNTASNPIILPYTSPSAIMAYGKRSGSSDLISSLSDYLGLPVTQSNFWSVGGSSEPVSVLPFMAYQHIYNSYFRDQNMEVLEGVNPANTSLYLVDNYKRQIIFGASSIPANQMTNLLTLRTSAWKKDYFTSALPSPQAGDDVELAFAGGKTPVYLDVDSMPFSDNRTQKVTDNQGSDFTTGGTMVHNNQAKLQSTGSGGLQQDSFLDPNNTMFVDVPGGSITINNLRRLFALQRFRELAERGGTRYPEMVQNFFHAFLPDWYFDRPIYLGGQVQPIQVGEVVQTVSDANNPLAYRGGQANSYGRTRTVRFNSPCHGFIMGILRILPEATYQQGIERMWTRKSIYDYAFPQFANLGEQEIYGKEIFANGDSGDNQVFGYTPRYAEYKTGHTHVSGKFRTDLDYWHLGRTFANRPLLNKQFIMMDSMDYDPFYVTSANTEHCYVDLYNNIISRRPLPYFGTPGGI